MFMLNSKQIIIVDNIQKTSKATLTFYNNSKKILQTQAGERSYYKT